MIKMENWKIGSFESKPGLNFLIFPNLLKSWEIGIFEALPPPCPPLYPPAIFEDFLL